MPEKDDFEEEISKNQPIGDDDETYLNMATEEAEMELDLPPTNGHKSLDEAETDSPILSDMQATLKRLFPRFTNPELDKLASAIMVARIHPESYMDLIVLTVIDILESHDPLDATIDVVGTLNQVMAIFSVGLEGKGRFDALELAGAAKEAEIEKLSEKLGLGFGKD